MFKLNTKLEKEFHYERMTIQSQILTKTRDHKLKT